jgi:exodeoxyribonuclease VII large subunit
MANALQNRVGGAIERWSERLDYFEKSALKREPARVLAEREQQVDWKAEGLSNALREALSRREEELADLRHRLALNHPLRKLERASGRFDVLAGRFEGAMETVLQNLFERVATNAASLKNLGPDSVLGRGYSIALDGEGNLVSSAKGVAPGDTLRTKFADGEVSSTVDAVKPALPDEGES